MVEGERFALAFAVLLLLAAFVAFVLPPLTNEMSSIWRGLPSC